jgi:LruC domain-containing protein
MKTLRSAIVLLFLVLGSTIQAQLTLNCESGDRNIEIGNCWGFGSTTYTNASASVISGLWSTKSNQLSSGLPTACWIKTPWMKVGSGDITFNARFESTAGTTRGIQLYYIPYDPASPPYYEGTPVQFYNYDWPKPWSTTVAQNFTIPIPSAIANSSDIYKIRVSYIGNGGTARINSDDFIFPGTYWSDPSNGCVPLPTIQDADGDGVADADDAYPADATRAYNSFFPGENQQGTLGFEDLWPSKGDYDFNDVVVDYRLQTVTNADNNVVEVFARFILRASGASYHNGFGFQLDYVEPGKITAVTGNAIHPGSIYSFASNGLENGQTYANCIVFDDFYKVMTWPGSGKGINTDPAAPFVPYVTLNVHLQFTQEAGQMVPDYMVTPDIYNFYIVANQERGKEIHLADRIPTDLVDATLFGTLDDDSDAGGDVVALKYYKTVNNLPWGINVVQGFRYPVEKAPIAKRFPTDSEAYYHFLEWASSSGNSYPDWFEDLPGYRNIPLIYPFPAK